MRKILSILGLMLILTSLIGCKFVFTREQVEDNPTVEETPTEDNNSNICPGCGRPIVKDPDTEGNETDGVTEDVVTENTHTHVYGESYSKNTVNHWRICSSCGEKSTLEKHVWDDGVVTKEPSETKEGIKKFTCTICKTIKEDAIPKLTHTHTYSSVWSSDETNHWLECECGETTEAVAHTWDSGVVTKEATCTEAGETTYICLCGATKVEEIEAKGHDYAEELSKDDTYHWYTCNCGDKGQLEEHTWDSGVVTKEPTLTEPGFKKFTCSVCSATVEKILPSLNHTHSFSPSWSSDETNHWHECSCGESSDTAQHTWDSGIITKDATEQEEGIKTYTCTICGAFKDEEIEKLPHVHNYEASWNSDSTHHWHECSCGEKQDLAIHSGGEATETELAVCSTCEESYGELKPVEITTVVNPPFADQMLTNAVYDGSDVLVSQVTTTSNGTHLTVEGQPFLFIGASIRVDAFMNCDNFNYLEVEPLFAEAAKLGVTCVQVPIEWAKLEIEENQFDFTYLFTMLYYANKYDLKIELLWYGTNMCGDTHSYTVPDYILRDGKTYPKFDALRTGEFWNYYGIMWFLDFDHPNLIARETNAIKKMMEYVYEFDSTHGGKKPLIGVQVLNEPDIFARWRVSEKQVLSNETGEVMTSEEAYAKISNSLDALGKEVKASKYKVYTRVNLATSTAADNLTSGNGIFTGTTLNDAPSFAKQFQELEGIDIIGDDAYTSSVKNIKGITAMYATKLANNFGHIAENDGNYGNTASLILTSVAVHGGYSIYDLITSPFFVDNNSSNIDQGIILFKDGSKNEFEYKSHYTQTKNIINGLKLASNVYGVSSADFIAFNINSDYPVTSVSQTIASTNVSIQFQTSNGAIGFAIDHGTYIDIYVTAASSITISNCSVTKVQTGYYTNQNFTSSSTLSTASSISLSANTLYRIEYNSSSKIASTTWDNIGG